MKNELIDAARALIEATKRADNPSDMGVSGDSDEVRALEAAIAKAESGQSFAVDTLRRIANHECMCCTGDCSCGARYEEWVKEALAQIQA